MLDDGSWIYAVAHDGIAGVWREGHGAAFYRLAESGELQAITVLRGIPYLVMIGTDNLYRFVALRDES
jgi:hypothetical protein